MSENHIPSDPGEPQDQSSEPSQEPAPGSPGSPAGDPGPAAAPPPPAAPPPAGSAGGDKTLMLILSYLGLLGIIPLLVEKDGEVQWHAKNGIALFLGVIVIWIAIAIISFLPFLGWLVGCGVIPLVSLGYLVLVIVAIMKALKGEKLRLPVLSDFADQW